MLKAKLNSSFCKKNAATDCFTKYFNFFVKFLKKIMPVLFFGPTILIFPHEIKSENQGREIQNYVRSGTTFQARKRKAYENAQKESGLNIKNYLINKSALQSKKGKSAAASQKMVESGLVTLEMFKKNRFFLKNPVQSSYTKLPDYEESNKISREALKMSKYRARITGRVKPEYLYAESPSRDALKMTRTRARVTGPAKPGIIFAEDVGRDAMKISKTRAVATGPVKPETLYSEQASRDAKKISIKTAKEYTTERRDMSVYSNIIESMSKRPALNSKPVNIEKTSKK